MLEYISKDELSLLIEDIMIDYVSVGTDTSDETMDFIKNNLSKLFNKLYIEYPKFFNIFSIHNMEYYDDEVCALITHIIDGMEYVSYIYIDGNSNNINHFESIKYHLDGDNVGEVVKIESSISHNDLIKIIEEIYGK